MASSGVGRRVSLFETINRLSEEEDEVIFQLIEEINEAEVEARGFRWHSTSTQKQQDRILRDYEAFCHMMKLFRADEENISETQKELILFPANHKDLYTQVRGFMIFVARFGRGRSSAHISYKGIVKYRAAIMFWTNRVHQSQDPPLPPVPSATLFNKLTEAIQAAAKKYKLTLTGQLNVTRIGLSEVRQLLDYDMAFTPNIEVAEGHHLAWCLGRVCAVRPGSIGPSKHANWDKDPYLMWRDVSIRRGEEKGMFQVKISFRNLKTNFEDPVRASNKSAHDRVLTCTVLPPKAVDNLIFSIPHRLLVIALRRGILEGISTLDELFNGDTLFIPIKQDCLDLPVILASGPRGLSTGTRPAASTNLTSYLQLRGQKIGYEKLVTFYSIRRRSAEDLTRRIGPDAARTLMNHDYDSRVLEKYYINLTPTTNVSALTLSEHDDVGATGESNVLVAESDELAINVLSTDAAQHVHGPALNALIRRTIATDPDFPIGASAKEQSNYRRRVRYAALKTLLSDEVQKQREAMGRGEFKDRVTQLSHSNTMQEVLDQARKSIADAPEQMNEDEDTENSLIDAATGMFFEPDDVAEPDEEDLEDQIGSNNPDGVIRETDEGISEDPTDQDDADVPYDVAAKSFMDVLLSNSLNKYRDFKNNPVLCPLCEEDPTVDDERKNKKFSSESHLNDHMESFYHTPKARWIREIEQQFANSDSDRYLCPYCTDTISAEDSPQGRIDFPDVKSLLRHVQSSTAESFGAAHDRLKRLDGWYEPGFEKNQSEHKRRRDSGESERYRQRFLRPYGLRYSNEVELPQPIPHPTKPSVVCGDPHTPVGAPGAIAQDIKDISPLTTIPKHLEGIVVFADPREMPTAIPDHLKDAIVVNSTIEPVSLTKNPLMEKYRELFGDEDDKAEGEDVGGDSGNPIVVEEDE